MSTHDVERAIAYLKAIKKLEEEGEAGKINNKKYTEALKEVKSKFSLVFALKLALLNLLTVSCAPFSGGSYTTYVYKWQYCTRGDKDHVKELQLLLDKTLEERKEREEENGNDSV